MECGHHIWWLHWEWRTSSSCSCLRINNSKGRGPETEEEDSVEAENEAESKSGDDGKEFHDSDCDFSKDEDDIIFKNWTATIDNAIDGQIVIDNAGVGKKAAIPNAEEKKVPV